MYVNNHIILVEAFCKLRLTALQEVSSTSYEKRQENVELINKSQIAQLLATCPNDSPLFVSISQVEMVWNATCYLLYQQLSNQMHNLIPTQNLNAKVQIIFDQNGQRFAFVDTST